MNATKLLKTHKYKIHVHDLETEVCSFIIHQLLPFCKQINTTVNNLLYMYIYTDWGGDYRNALRPSVCLSVRNISCPRYNLRMH